MTEFDPSHFRLDNDFNDVVTCLYVISNMMNSSYLK